MFAMPFFKLVRCEIENKKGKYEEHEPYYVFVLEQKTYNSQSNKMKLNFFKDVDLLTILGTGSLGKVFLGKLGCTGKYYAFKMLPKNKIID